MAVRHGGAGRAVLVAAGKRAGHLTYTCTLHWLFDLLGWRFTVLLMTHESGDVIQRDDL